MSQAENLDGPVSKDTETGPEGPANEANEPEIGGLGEYDSNIVQISDTEEAGVPLDDIKERYEKGDVDAFYFGGDSSKKDQLSPEEYAEAHDSTFEALGELREVYDAPVYSISGNHCGVSGAHSAKGDPHDPTDEKFMEEVEEVLEEQYGEFVGFEGNVYEFFANRHGVEDITYGSAEIGDITLVGGTHHMGREVPKEWLDEMPELEEMGYDPEEVASEIQVKEDYGGFLSKIPFIGKIFKYALSSSKNPDPDEISLDDVPGNYDKTEEHEQLDGAKELQEYFEKMIEEAGENVFLAHHGVPASLSQHGSVVLDKVLEEYSDRITAVGGGHDGQAGLEELYGTQVGNTNGGAVIEYGFNEGNLEYSDVAIKPSMGEKLEDQEMPEEEEMIESINEQMEAIDENGIDEVAPGIEQVEDRLGEEIDEERKEIIEAQIQQQREQIEAAYDYYQENGEFESEEEFEEVMRDQQSEPPQPESPGQDGAGEAPAGA